MDGVVRADKKARAGFRELVGGGQHQLPDCGPVTALDALHVSGQRVGVHGHLGVSVRAQQLRTLKADGAVTQRRPFGRAGDDPDVLRHVADTTRTPAPALGSELRTR